MFKSVTLTLFTAVIVSICSTAKAGCNKTTYRTKPTRYVNTHVTYAHPPIVTPIVHTQVVPVTKTTVVEKHVVLTPRKLPEVHAGATINIFGRFFGAEPGYIAMKIGKLDLAGKILAWSPTKATVRIPNVEVEQPTKLIIQVFNANGAAKKTVRVSLVNRLPDVQEIHVVEPVLAEPESTISPASVELISQ